MERTIDDVKPTHIHFEHDRDRTHQNIGRIIASPQNDGALEGIILFIQEPATSR